jgi:hypothetical protein
VPRLDLARMIGESGSQVRPSIQELATAILKQVDFAEHSDEEGTRKRPEGDRQALSAGIDERGQAGVGGRYRSRAGARVL